MKKFTIYNLQFTIFLLLFTFYILHFTFYITTALAVDSTPSSKLNPKLLEEFNKQVASKAAKLKLDIDKKLTNKAYVGKVKTKSASSITLATKTGPKIASINQDTVFESKIKGKKYSQKLISEEDDVASLGDVDDTGVLIAKKIVLLDPKPYTLNPKSYLWGQIVAASEKLLTLKDKTLKNIAIAMPNQTSVKVGDFVLLSGNPGKNDIFKAEYVYVIPQGGILKPRKVSTPSAKLATPSAKPKSSTR
ncbi:hypothetical protein HYZ05_00140 [Candidatus Daviesbacteria bacterium]|nr:hypothetical protein [Candidatus Daviesbacteria bacterium]